MCNTLKEKILTLPDHVLVFPIHVSGSLCGGNIGSMLVTTIGYECKLNDMLARIDNETDFEQSCLDLGPLPMVTPYWYHMRKQNQDGPALLGVLSEPPSMQPGEFAQRIAGGALPGLLGDVPVDKPVAVYCASALSLVGCASLLRRNGHRDVCNVIGGFTAWEAEKLPVEGR